MNDKQKRFYKRIGNLINNSPYIRLTKNLINKRFSSMKFTFEIANKEPFLDVLDVERNCSNSLKLDVSGKDTRTHRYLQVLLQILTSW